MQQTIFNNLLSVQLNIRILFSDVFLSALFPSDKLLYKYQYQFVSIGFGYFHSSIEIDSDLKNLQNIFYIKCSLRWVVKKHINICQ